jgi:hypothetical protein
MQQRKSGSTRTVTFCYIREIADLELAKQSTQKKRLIGEMNGPEACLLLWQGHPGLGRVNPTLTV